MTVALKEDDDGKILTVTLNGKLTKADYEHLGPEVDRLIARMARFASRLSCTISTAGRWARCGTISNSISSTFLTSSDSR